jgi:Holliday junction resolvase RusA-like endonuclease
MIIEFDLPDQKLNPNKKNGKHYQSYKDAKNKAKEMARVLTLEAWHKDMRDIYIETLTITFIYPTRHNRDLDNAVATCKAHIDGMCAAFGFDDGKFTTMILKKEYKKGVSKMIFEI